MRLYSRTQVIGIACIAAAVAFTGAYLIRDADFGGAFRALTRQGPASGKIATGKKTSTTGSDIISSGSFNSDPAFTLKTNVPQNPLTVSDSGAGYTQDETQNITVYQKANEAVVNITTEIVGHQLVPRTGPAGRRLGLGFHHRHARLHRDE